MLHLFTTYGQLTPQQVKAKEIEVTNLHFDISLPVDIIFNAIEDDVNRLRDVKMEVVDLCFLGFDLLGSELPICGEKVSHQIADAMRVLASSSVEQGTEVNRINGINNLSNKSFLGCLANLKDLMAGGPDFTSRVDLSRSSWVGRDKGTRIGRCYPCNGWL